MRCIAVGSTFVNENFKVYDTCYTDGKFFVWAELVNDMSYQRSTTTVVTRLISININMENNVPFAYNAYTSSGATAPPTTAAYQWYDTANNKCVHTDKTTGNISLTLLSLPFGIVTSTETEVLGSVTQVFNGRGYIGSTIWVDKGVKGLIPYGRNEDGTLRNIEVVTEKLLTLTNNSGLNIPLWYVINPSIEISNSTTDHWVYDEESNYYKHENTIGRLIVVASSLSTNGAISDFQSKQPFRAVDQNSIRYDSSTSTLYIGV